MKLILNKATLLEQLQIVSRFTSNRLNTQTALQGIYIRCEKETLHFYATDLNTFCHSTIPASTKETASFSIEPRKLIEFLQILGSGDLELLLNEKIGLCVTQGKTKGNFPLLSAEDFPLPPVLKDKENEVDAKFFKKNLPLLLFTASSDDARPVLAGINFEATEKGLSLVATDGFRLSVVKVQTKGGFSSMIIPASFLQEVVRSINETDKVTFIHSKSEQIVRFKVQNIEFYSRLIEGEFPPYERVVPDDKKSTVTIQKEELLRNSKIISIFARDFSNVIIYHFTKKGLTISPKKEANAENTTTQDIELVGEEMNVAFNYKYLVDFLNHTMAPEIIIELLRPDAPVVFKPKGDESFFHIIMPVRIQE